MKRLRVRSSLSPAVMAAVLAANLAPASAAEDQSSQPSASTTSVYVPGYRSESWEDLAGSIIASDSAAATYTIFCTNTDDCHISGPMPLTFAEGPSYFSYSGSIESKLTVEISCRLASTTAATCSQYSSLGSGFEAGNITGPTEISSTETHTGSAVQWGVLTLTDSAPPATGAATTSGGSGAETAGSSDSAWFYPTETGTGSSWAAPRVDATRSIMVGVAMTVAGLLVM